MAEQVILITGAGGGLGTSVVSFFLDKGFRVIATVTSEAGKKGITPHPFLDIQVVDLSDEAGTTAFVEEQVRKYQTIHAALLLVGGFAMGPFAGTKGADLRKMYTLNFETAFFVSRPLYAHMLSQGKGRIIFIGARPAIEPSQGKTAVAYALSKSLLFDLAGIINADAKGKNIVAHVVVPSTIDTPANRENMPKADFDSWVRPEQLAEIFYFICSDTATVLREPVWKVYSQA